MTLAAVLLAVAAAMAVRSGPDARRLRRILGRQRERSSAATHRATGRASRDATASAPFALDLIAACIEAGESPAKALSLVASCVDEPLSGVLTSVSRALDLGASAEQAWAMTPVDAVPALRVAADRFVHAEQSGAALAPALVSVAAAERSKLAAARAIAAKRVGVLAVAPLGVCFLPAFVLAGVVPVVAGLFTQLSF